MVERILTDNRAVNSALIPSKKGGDEVMRILANATDNIWRHHVGAIHVLQQTERGVVGIQECKDQNGTLRRDIVFVEGSRNKAKRRD